MKSIFGLVRILIDLIAFFFLLAGIILVVIGTYSLGFIASYLSSENARGLIGVTLLHAVDLFLLAVVFFVMSIGILLLFNNTDSPFPINLPQWLRVKNFTQLKVILWEAILTTLVVSIVSSLVEMKHAGKTENLSTLIVPAAVLTISLSLFFLKTGEKSNRH